MLTALQIAETSYTDLVQEEATDFRVHARVYTDPLLYEQEMRQIFEKSWIYIGHESEVAHPGDYRTGRMGTQPIIIARSKDGGINVLLNVCRHRANAICREERGNSLNFRCPYHAWVYTNTGELIGVADRPRYPEGFSTEDLNLMQAPCVGVYRGLIFASLSAEVPSLEEHLSPIKHLIDLWADRSPEGEHRVLLPHKYGYQGNWKFQAENGVDGYHAGFVHESAFATFAHFGISRYAQRPPIKREGLTRGFPGGHSTLEGGYEDGRGNARSLPQLYQEYMTQLTQRHGEERARDIVSNHHLFIFPNVYLFDDLIRVIQPIALEETEIYSHPFRLGGVPDEFNARRLYEVTRQLSTTGLVNPADLEMFTANQTGLHARNMEWLVLSRGMDRETVLPSGERIGGQSDETPQRAFYHHWSAVMTRNGGGA
jgi:phenylpropionate dioxygenase-like ring-hydroxylating dioxygenase large terminal subunit